MASEETEGGLAVDSNNMPLAAAARQAIDARTCVVGIVGLGYVGLPLAVELARAGFETIGLDLDPRKIASISAGESYIPDVATSDIHALVGSGQLRATTDYRVVADLDTVNSTGVSPRALAERMGLTGLVPPQPAH